MKTSTILSLSLLMATSLQADDLEIRIMSPADANSRVFRARPNATQPVLALMSRQQIEFITTDERAGSESLNPIETRVLHETSEKARYAIMPSKPEDHAFPAFNLSYKTLEDGLIELVLHQPGKKGPPRLRLTGKRHHYILFELTDSGAKEAVLCSVAVIEEDRQDGAARPAAPQE